MFNNLIESSSHAREFKRRGSFVLLTIAVYAMLLAIAGVASVYAYDAHLSAESTELDLISYVPLDTTKAVTEQPRRPKGENTAKNSAKITQSVRPVLIDAVNPNNVPQHVSTIASLIPPAPRGAVIGPKIVDATNAGLITNSSGPSDTNEPGGVRDIGPAPPAPTPKPVPKVVQKKVINSDALELPKPPYPQLAIKIGVQGTVAVQVLIDESGKVISAHAVSGHPFLVEAAKQAAYRARFSPAMIGDQPVKVSGVITYNFILRQ